MGTSGAFELSSSPFCSDFWWLPGSATSGAAPRVGVATGRAMFAWRHRLCGYIYIQLYSYIYIYIITLVSLFVDLIYIYNIETWPHVLVVCQSGSKKVYVHASHEPCLDISFCFRSINLHWCGQPSLLKFFRCGLHHEKHNTDSETTMNQYAITKRQMGC